jgi:hypothetical protein
VRDHRRVHVCAAPSIKRCPAPRSPPSTASPACRSPPRSTCSPRPRSTSWRSPTTGVAEAGLGPYARPPASDAEAAGRAAADLILTELGWIDQRGQRRRGTAALRLPLTWDGGPGVATGTARALRNAWKLLGIQAPSVTAGWAYVLSLLRAGKFSLALARLAGASDMDLAPWFHSRGAHNLSGVADSELDAALDAYRHALTRAERDAAKRSVAARLAALHPVSVLHAPVAVLLASRALTGLEFIDDLPRLDSLGLGAAPPVLLHTGGG